MATFAATVHSLAFPYYWDTNGAPQPNPDGESFGLHDPPRISGSRTVGGTLASRSAIAGHVSEGPGVRIFERIHAIPTLIGVGTVTDPIEVEGILWNAYRSQRAILSQVVQQNTQGVSFSGIEPFTALEPLRDAVITYLVSAEGPVVIDALFSYVFDLQTAEQRLVGQRGAVVLARPNASGYQESEEYATDVFRALDGRTYGTSKVYVTQPPRRSISFGVGVYLERDLARLENVLRFGSRFSVSVPLWWSLSRLSLSTDGSAVVSCPVDERDFAAGSSVLFLPSRAPLRPEFAVRVVEEVQGAGLLLNAPLGDGEFAAGDLVLPLVSCAAPQRHQLTLSRHGGARGQLTFVEVDN